MFAYFEWVEREREARRQAGVFLQKLKNKRWELQPDGKLVCSGQIEVAVKERRVHALYEMPDEAG